MDSWWINIPFHFSMEVHPKVIPNIQQPSNMTHKERTFVGNKMRSSTM